MPEMRESGWAESLKSPSFLHKKNKKTHEITV